MPNVIPTKTPHDVPPVAGHRPLDHPVVPPDDPNADRQDRRPDIDPPPTDPPLRAPSENPGVVEPPARACGLGAIGVIAQSLLGRPTAANELLNSTSGG